MSARAVLRNNLGVLLMLVAWSSCDSTEITPLGFDPFDTENGVLSVYGYLEAGILSQTIRAQLLRRTIERPTTPEDAAVGAQVTTEAASTGAVTSWTPRLVRFADGTYAEVYDATFNPLPGETYRLAVERGTDRATAEVTVPETPRGSLAASSPPQAQTITWAPVSRLADTRLVFRIGCGPGSQAITVPDALTVEQDGTRAQTTVDLAAARTQIGTTLGVGPGTVLFVASVSLTATVADASWTLPEDSTALVQPGTNSNVEGGYGRFGAVTRGIFAWKPDSTTLDGLALEACP